MDKPMTFNEWMGKQGNLALVHANCCRIAYEAGQQSQQAKVEELQTQLSLQRQRVKAFEEELTSSRNYGDELQKRVDAALAVLTEYYTGSYDESPDLVVDIEQALKGKDERLCDSNHLRCGVICINQVCMALVQRRAFNTCNYGVVWQRILFAWGVIAATLTVFWLSA